MYSQEAIDRRFTYHPPTGDKPQKFVEIREEARHMAMLLVQHCPPSFELETAIIKLEEAVFWANASIARPPEPPLLSEVDPT